MDGQDLSDEQLMLMFRYGNRSAFELLFEKHRAGVYNFARRMVGNGSAAEDVCQDVFLRVVTSAGTYEPRARFRTWLFTIARNCCLSGLRQRRPTRGLTADLEERRASGPASEVAAGEAGEMLEEAIRELPVKWREAFLLRYRHGFEYREIGEMTGQPMGTVKTCIHRARLRLAEAMKDYLEAV